MDDQSKVSQQTDHKEDAPKVDGSDSNEEVSSFKKSFINVLTLAKEVLKTSIETLVKVLDDSSYDYRSIATQLTLERDNHSKRVSVCKTPLIDPKRQQSVSI